MAKRSKRDVVRKVKPGPKGQGVRSMRRVLFRLPDDLASWLDDTAAEFGISRDAFMRQTLTGMRASFQSAERHGTPEARLFRKLEATVEEVTERAMSDVLERALKPLGGFTPGAAKGGK